MDDENRIRLKNALRLISASNEDLFFNSNFDIDDSSAGDGIEIKDPFDDDAYSSVDVNETPEPNCIFAKVIDWVLNRCESVVYLIFLNL